MYQQALAATALDGEAHAFIQLPGPAVVCHDRKLEPVYLVLQSPLLEFPSSREPTPCPLAAASTPITTCAVIRLRPKRPPLAST